MYGRADFILFLIFQFFALDRSHRFCGRCFRGLAAPSPGNHFEGGIQSGDGGSTWHLDLAFMRACEPVMFFVGEVWSYVL